MTDAVLKAVKLKKSSTEHEGTLPQPKRPRTAEDFLLFCQYILDYVNYDETKTEEVVVEKTENSIGDDESSPNSVKSESAISSATEDDRKSSDTDSDEGSYDLVTCYCTKPFAGRPMIECSKCLTWVHLSCAKVRKSSIPDVFVCAKCKEIQMTALSQALRLSE